MLKSVFSLLALASTVVAVFTPTEPGSEIIAKPGSPISIQWIDDGKAPPMSQDWTNFRIDFMTGDNSNQIVLENVATGLDATKQSSYSWPCPVVNPPAPIYFFMFTSSTASVSPAWTTRFGITAADGVTTVKAPNATQPTGEAIPWGVGSIVSNSTSTNSSSSAPASASATSLAANSTASSTPSGAANATSAAPTFTANVTAPLTHSSATKSSVAIGFVGMIAGLVSFVL